MMLGPSFEPLEQRVVLSAAGFGFDDVVAITGDSAPDAQGNADGMLADFNRRAPVLNEAGKALFSAGLNDTTSATEGLFLASEPSIVQIVRDGQSVPGIDGKLFSFASSQLNDNGQVVFESGLDGVSSDEDTGMFIASVTQDDLVQIEEVVREGDPAPDTTGFDGRFQRFADPEPGRAFNNAGQVAFGETVIVEGSGVPEFGFFRADADGNLVQIVRAGQVLPEDLQTVPGKTLQIVSFVGLAPGPTINDRGQAAFSAVIGGNGLFNGIFLGDGASPLKAIALPGVPLPNGGTFNGFGTSAAQVPVNDRGEVAFLGRVDTEGSFSRSIFLADGTPAGEDGTPPISEVAREGQSLGNGEFLDFSGEFPPRLNENGDVVFGAGIEIMDGSVTGDLVGFALFRGNSEGEFVEIVRTGQSLPGGDHTVGTILDVALNDSGQVAILDSVGFGLTEKRSLLFHDDDRGLMEIAREGDELNGREIIDLRFAGGIRDNADGLNNAGQVAFSFQLDNGDEGVAIVDPLAASGTTVVDVDTFDDVVDSSDGVTSLREAVIRANSNPGDFEIRLQAGAYWLTISGEGEDLAATGDLDIRDNGRVTIVGAGAGQTVIDAGGDDAAIPSLADRVFHVLGGASLDVEGLKITGGVTGLRRDGGGIAIDGGALALSASEVSGNSAGGDGGGIANNGGEVVIADSTIADNSAEPFGAGGGLLNRGQATVTGSTFSGNRAAGSGGGIHNDDSAQTLSVASSTFSGNTADRGGGMHLAESGAIVLLHNTIVAGNHIPGGFGPASNDIDGMVDPESAFNLIGHAATSGGLTDGTNGNIVGVDVTTVLDTALADNGGPTLTHALLSGSAAIDAGDPDFDPAAFDPPLVNDQRGEGFDRVVGGRIDIGAVELQDGAPTGPQVTGRVWLDADANGVRDDGEAGVANVTVRLRDAFGGEVLDETTTDDAGAYRLRARSRGEGFVEFLGPDRHIYTRPGRGGGDDRDSDAAPGAGLSRTDVFG
ncbi:MAG: LEPR-XLL domain-containing protein, partial [Planctomycetes bacterium]|nr:LEPR-XLL domain-containing protein [Planctomycetota bacterium]